MKKFKIFVSSVQKELQEERRTVKDYIKEDALLSEYFDVFLFEDSPAKSKSAEKSYLDEVGKSDIYVGLLGNQYGQENDAGISPIESEFLEAKKKHKNILVYIKGNSKDDKLRDRKIQNLIKSVHHSTYGFSYKRFIDNNELTDHIYESLIDFLKEKGIVGRGAFDERICEDATFKDIDQEKVRWFLGVAKSVRKFPLEIDTPVKDVFTHLKLLNKGKLTNAAILLFGKNPHRFFLQAEVKCLQFFGTEIKKPFTSFKVYNGNLFEQVDKAVAFVLDIIKQAVIQQEHTAQFSRPFEIPIFAIQEAIVNAVVHRNYNLTSGVQVMVFIDRVEIWNSGSLPSELGIDDLKKPHTSFPANPLLAHPFYLADYIQQTGSGTLEMVEQCRKQGTPEPNFVLIRNVEFRAILPRDIYTQTFLESRGFNERQISAVQLVKKKGDISIVDLQAVYKKITRKTLYRDLQDLVDKGVLKSRGDRKGRKYRI